MTAIDLPSTPLRADAPAEPPAPTPPGRSAGQIVLDVLAAMGREPTIWGPWMMMAPHPPRSRSLRRTPDEG